MLTARKWVLAVGVVCLAAYGGSVLATPGSMITSHTVSLGRFDQIDVSGGEAAPEQVTIRAKGASDVYVVTNTIAPGGHTGWHTHPGPSLITVTSGTAVAYDGDDPTCTPRLYPAGSGFIDPGNGHVHLLRNEGSEDLVTVAVQILPAAAERRVDAAAPGNCPF